LDFFGVQLELSLFPVTNKIITSLFGDPWGLLYKPSFATITGKGATRGVIMPCADKGFLGDFFDLLVSNMLPP